MAVIPSELYQLRFLDNTGNLLLLLRRWDRLTYTQRVDGPDDHYIQIRTTPTETLGETLRSMPKDIMLFVDRVDPITGVTSTPYAGFQQTVSEQTQSNGNIFFSLYGADFTRLLERRIVLPPAGQENSIKSGYAESIIKDFIVESAISPVDTNRIIPGLSIARDQQRGGQAEYSARYTLLASVVSAIAEGAYLRYGIYPDDIPGNFIFDCRRIWGTDRRAGTANPTIFDLELNNMVLPILSTNRRHEKNVVYVGGQGEGVDRAVIERQNYAATLESPWARSEGFEDARKESDTAALEVVAQQYLEERGSQVEFDFEIYQTAGTRWLRDWFLGDLVTARYYGRQFDKEITEVAVTVTSGSASQSVEKITVALEDIRWA